MLTLRAYKDGVLKFGGVAVAVGVLAAAQATPAHAFKAKYYKDCAAPLDVADELIDRPSKAGKAMGGLGKAAGVLGSFGGFGGLGKAAQVANQVSQYSGYIQSAASLSQRMMADHPDPAERWGAYSSQMSTESDKLARTQAALTEAQGCYDDAYDALADQVASGEMKAKKAKRPLKEINKGVKETGDLLMAALDQARNNSAAYGDALGGETGGLDVSRYMSNQASYCRGATGQMAGWCAQYGSSSTALTTDAFNRAWYSGNTAAASNIAGIHRLNALAGMGGLSAAGLGSMAANFGGGQMGAPSQQSLQQLGAASQSYVAAATALQPLIEPQKALEAKVKALPSS